MFFHRRLRSWLLALTLSLLTVFSTAAEPIQLDNSRPLLYRTAAGEVRPAASPTEWASRHAHILQEMQAVMGPLPTVSNRDAPKFEVREEADAGSYIRRLITYHSDSGTPTPAYLCIPKDVQAGLRRAPAVLCLHPTDDTEGHKVVVGLGGRQNRQYAAELAERGYITLSPAYPHLANYRPALEPLGYHGGTMKAIWDNIRGIDLLAAMPEVDPARGFAAIGHSLGGHNAIFTAAMDQRISVIVSSCGFDSFLAYYGGDENNWRLGKGWCQVRYMPRLAEYRGRLEEIPFDFPELLAALAPRRIFINAPLQDQNFDWRSVDQCVAAARPVYRLFDAETGITVRHPDCPHDFPTDIRLEAYRQIDTVLRP